MRRSVPLVLLAFVVACGGSPSPAATTTTTRPIDRAATDYAASAQRALDGTAFSVLGVGGVADLVVGLCDGLGVGSIGVVAADTGIAAPDADVAILLEVLRTGLDQVCEDKVVVDYTSIYLRTVEQAVTDAGATAAYDEIGAIRAAPAVCAALRAGNGAERALLDGVEAAFGVGAASVEGLTGRISPEQGAVAGVILAAATAIVCPEHITEVQGFLEQQ